MKKLIIIVLITSLSLNARINPFEPTAEYLTKSEIPVEKEKVTNKDDGSRTMQINSAIDSVLPSKIDSTMSSIRDSKMDSKIHSNMNSKKNHNAMNTDNNLSQNRDMKAGMMVDTKPIKMDSNSSMELTALELAELRALIVAKRAMKPVITLPVKKEIRKVMMKKTEPFVNVSYRPFKFLSIDVNKKNILIKTKRTHELVRFFVEKATNRFVFDFKGRIDNATLRKTFQNNKYFKGYIIGSHKYKGFFRVVILNKFKNVYKYDVKTKNNLVDIKFIK